MKLDLSYGGLVRLAVTVVAVAMVLYHMWVIVAGRRKRSSSAARICCSRSCWCS